MSHAPHFATCTQLSRRLEQPLLRGVDECTRIVRDASKTRRGPTVYEVMSFEHLRKSGLHYLCRFPFGLGMTLPFSPRSIHSR
jgi:hypothetical protein